jgi:excisionase family DNA binding protein
MNELAKAEPLIGVRDVAARLGVGVRAVYLLVEDGSLPHFRIGRRRIRFSPEQVESYLVSSERKAPGGGA